MGNASRVLRRVAPPSLVSALNSSPEADTDTDTHTQTRRRPKVEAFGWLEVQGANVVWRRCGANQSGQADLLINRHMPKRTSDSTNLQIVQGTVPNAQTSCGALFLLSGLCGTMWVVGNAALPQYCIPTTAVYAYCAAHYSIPVPLTTFHWQTVSTRIVFLKKSRNDQEKRDPWTQKERSWPDDRSRLLIGSK